jgi:hypothetical protein
MILACKGIVPTQVLELFIQIKKHAAFVCESDYTITHAIPLTRNAKRYSHFSAGMVKLLEGYCSFGMFFIYFLHDLG